MRQSTQRIIVGLACASACLTGCGPESNDPSISEGSSSSTSSTTGEIDDETSDGTTGSMPETTTGAATSTRPDGTTGSTGDDSAGFISPPDGGSGGVAPGFCFGLRPVGHLSTVHTEVDPPQEPLCDQEPAGCGTDPIGTWTVQAHCGFEALPNLFASQCPDSTMELLDSDIAGTRTFSPDLTFEYDSTVMLDVAVLLDAMRCFGASCAAFEQSLDAEQNLTASCEDAEDGCACMLSITEQQQVSGTYAVTEEGIVLSVDGQDSDPIPFCRETEQLTTWETLHEQQPHPDVPCTSARDCVDAFADQPEYEDFDWSCFQQ